MTITLEARPARTFADPLEILSDCHRQIEGFLLRLILTTDQCQGGPLLAAQRDIVEDALCFFKCAVPLHERDEEKSLIPRLRCSNHPDARAALGALESLNADRAATEADHAEVELLGRRWLEEGTLPAAETTRLRGVLRRLCAAYGRNIRIEDGVLFPAARRALDSADLWDLGSEMALRRELDPCPEAGRSWLRPGSATERP